MACVCKDLAHWTVADAGAVVVHVTHLVAVTVADVDVVRAAHVRLAGERVAGPGHVVEAEVSRRFQTAVAFCVGECAVGGGWGRGEEKEEEECGGG